MKKTLTTICLLISCSFLFSNCKTVNTQQNATTANKGLKDYYKDYFTMGVAVNARSLKTDEAGLILKEFGSLTAENAMKMGPIHPKENKYNFKDADSVAA